MVPVVFACIALATALLVRIAIMRSFGDLRGERDVKPKRRGKLKPRFLVLAARIGANTPGKTGSGETTSLLEKAGSSIDEDTWSGMQVISACMGFALGLALPCATFVGKALEVAITTVMGALLPRLVLASKTRRRRKAIERELPRALELMSICVKAGRSIEGALRTVTQRTQGPLSKEFERVDNEVNLLGMSTTRALERMAARCDSNLVSSFTAALVQASNQGTSIAKVLSSQAHMAQDEHYSKVLERVNKVPTKMVPVVFMCFMPVIIILAMAPSVYNTITLLMG